EISVEIYPEEANLYDSIGEFYNSLGNKEKAIEFYTKALEINPKYPNAANAKELINKLKEQ
ncbi:MAG TPA: tetratricopeptide repeat protein, partial [Pyrinomonadaceae bacterium]